MNIVLEKIREINRYIKDNFLKLSIILFVIYIATSVISYFVVVSYPPERMDGIIEKLREMYNVDNMMDKQGFSLFWAIFILSCAMGLKFCVLLIKKIFRKAKGESLKYHYEKLSEILMLYIIPFLLIAAFLEGIVEHLLFG